MEKRSSHSSLYAVDHCNLETVVRCGGIGLQRRSRIRHCTLLTTATRSGCGGWTAVLSHSSLYAVDHCNRSMCAFLKTQKQLYIRILLATRFQPTVKAELRKSFCRRQPHKACRAGKGIVAVTMKKADRGCGISVDAPALYRATSQTIPVF